jgi:hypothetical protein
MDKLILRKYIILYLLILAGIFIHFPFVGIVGNIIIKIMIISAVSYYLYDSWLREGAKNGRLSEADEPLSEYEMREEIPSAENTVIEKDEAEFEPLDGISKEQFHFLSRQFNAFIDLLSPKNAYLCYRNQFNEVFLLRDKLLDRFKETEDAIPVELISLIEHKGGVLLENKLNPDSSLFPFYNDTGYHVGSVLGIKTPLGSSESLYWIFDSDSNDFFKKEIVPAIEALGEGARSFLAAENSARTLADEKKSLEFEFGLAIELHEACTIEEKIERFVRLIIVEYEADKLTLALLKDMNIVSETAVIRKMVGMKNDGYEEGAEFSIRDGLTGWVVMKNRPYLIDSIDKGEHFIPRFTMEEKTNFGLSSYLAAPISYKSRAIGALVIEHKEEKKYSNKDKDKMIAYCAIFAKAIEKDVITEIGGINNG